MTILKNTRALTYLSLLALLALLCALFIRWHDGSGEPLSRQEIDRLLQAIEKNLASERTGRIHGKEDLNRLRAFAESDDGKSFYMINLLRLNDRPRYPRDSDPGGTVDDAKKRYFRETAPLLIGRAGYPVVGIARAGNAVVNDGDADGSWDQFFLIRYRSRRDFLHMVADPRYAGAIIHKLAADRYTLLVPVSASTVFSAKPSALLLLVIIGFLLTRLMGGWKRIFGRVS